MVKHKDNIWNNFELVEDGQSKKAKCLVCSNFVSARSDRLKAHLAKCNEDIPSLPSTPSRKRNISEVYGSPVPDKEADIDSDSQSTPKRSRLRQRNLSGFTVSTDPTTQLRLDNQIAKMFYACNVPFNLAENEIWKETVEMLRPGYQPPNRFALAGPLLNNTHENLLTDMKSELKGKNVTLVQDGWSDIHNTPVIATSLHTHGKSFFYKAVETGTNKKTAAYCTSIALTSIDEAEKEFDCKIIAVVTDNEKKMEVMRKKIHEQRSEICTYGCSAHWFNLLGQDVTPSQVINQVTEINKYFRNHHIPGALLGQCQGSVKPQIPGDTRWNSQLKCVDTYLTNRPFMLLVIAQSEDSIDSHIRNLVQNAGLTSVAKHLLEQLTPIANALDSSQSDSVYITDACEQWLTVVDASELEPHKSALDKRFNQALTSVHFLANILHPKYRGKKLSGDHVNKAQEFFLEMKESLLPHLLKYMRDDSVIPKALANENTVKNTDPIIWWKSVKLSSVFPEEFCDFALKVLQMPASSAGIERVFSNFALVQTKLRNRLGVEKAGKLVFCYRMLNKSEVDW